SAICASSYVFSFSAIQAPFNSSNPQICNYLITQLPDYPIHMTTPPPTMIVWPVMNAAAGEARNTAAPATSLGVPHRLSGVDSATVRRSCSLAPAPNEVSIQPGARMLTRTRGATDRARHLLKARMPPLAAP